MIRFLIFFVGIATSSSDFDYSKPYEFVIDPPTTPKNQKSSSPYTSLSFSDTVMGVFKVFDIKRIEFAPSDVVEIWKVDASGKKMALIGRAVPPGPRMTSGDPIPRVLEHSFHSDKEEKIWFKAFIRHQSGHTAETQILAFEYFDGDKMMAGLSACMKKTDLLRKTIPSRSLSGEECTAKKGRIENSLGSLMCVAGERTPEKVCSVGKPIGWVQGMRCPCICCL